MVETDQLELKSDWIHQFISWQVLTDAFHLPSKSIRRHDTDKPLKIYRLEFGPKALNVSTEMLKNNETRTSPRPCPLQQKEVKEGNLS